MKFIKDRFFLSNLEKEFIDNMRLIASEQDITLVELCLCLLVHRKNGLM